MGSFPSNSTNTMKDIQRSRRSLKPFDSANSKYRQYIHQQLSIDDEDLNAIQEIMKNHCILRYFSQGMTQICLKQMQKWKFSEGYYIYRQHDVSGQIYLIKEGGVYVQIDCNIIKTLTSNEYFGEDTVCFQSPRGESIRVASHQLMVYNLKKEVILPLIQKFMTRHSLNIVQSFNRIHFFNYLTNKEKDLFLKRTFLFHYQHQNIIFQKDQVANSFYIVQKGSVRIQISGKEDLIMKEGEYFGESVFFTTVGNGEKNQRKGRALANQSGTQVYAVGIHKIEENIGHQIRSIVFYNQEKWALYRNTYLSTLKNIDLNYLLQLFNVKEGRKFSILAHKKTKPKYIFIPLQVQINKEKNIKLYCSEYLKEQNKDQLLSQDIILTEGGYYAYAMIDEFKDVINLHKSSQSQRQIEIKLNKQPVYKILTLSIRNISKYSKKIPSSQYSTVLIVQDMKFGGQFILKIYKKKTKIRQMTAIGSESEVTSISKVSRFKTVKVINQLSLTSLSNEVPGQQKDLDSQINKLSIDAALVKREKEIMNNLNSPFLCGFYKAEQDQNHFYLFIEYIVGLTLQQIMFQFGNVPQSIMKYFLACIASALHYLHQNNVIYRNINPSNIMIKTNGHLVLTDFSCSKKLTSGRTNSIAGVPYYMAPQVIQQQQYTFNADVWSMGVILYEMMSGCLPFGEKSNDVLDIYQSVLTETLNMKRISNKNAKILLSALLQKDPTKRVKTPLQIRNFAFINDIEFDWTALLEQRMEPFYFPIKRSFNYTNFNNCQIFDASTVQECE